MLVLSYQDVVENNKILPIHWLEDELPVEIVTSPGAHSVQDWDLVVSV